MTLSKLRSPLAGMGMGQKIATVALLVLALIAGVALLSGGSSGSDGGSSGGFTPSTYTRSGEAPSGTATGSGHSSRGASSDDGVGTVSAQELPAEARETISLIDAGGPYPYSRDGVVFGNYERVLPKQAKGWYHEYTVKTPGAKNRGARRIIHGKDGTMYYTDDHYASFRRVER